MRPAGRRTENTRSLFFMVQLYFLSSQGETLIPGWSEGEDLVVNQDWSGKRPLHPAQSATEKHNDDAVKE